MRSTAIFLLGLVLLACENPTESNSSNYGGSGYGGSGTGNSTTSSGMTNPSTNSGPPYTVTYKNTTVNTTGSVPVDSATYQTGTSVTVKGNTGNLSWPPYTFIGWNTLDNGSLGGGGGTSYAPGSTLTIAGNVVLYGTWQY